MNYFHLYSSVESIEKLFETPSYLLPFGFVSTTNYDIEVEVIVSETIKLLHRRHRVVAKIDLNA